MASSTTVPAVSVPLFSIVFDSWFGGGKKPAPPNMESKYKQRIDCLNKLANIQNSLRTADEEYARASLAKSNAYENALIRMEAATYEYRDTWEKCEAIIKP